MAPRPLINLLLLGLVLVLGALAYLRPGAEAPPPRLTGLDPAEVEEVRIRQGSGPGLLLRRLGGGWLLAEPYDLPADADRVDRALQVLRAPSLRRLTPAEARPAQYGLDKPLVRLEVGEAVLEVGGSEPIRNRRYARWQGRIHLIDEGYLPPLLGPPESFLDHRILGREPRIEAIRTPDFRVYSGELGQWRIAPPEPAVSADRLTAWVERWRHARALQVLPAPEPADRPRVSVRLAGRAGPRVFELARQNGRELLVDRDLGLAYRLAEDSRLLRRPTGPGD